ncbi:MAG TPA: hypothetical protein IAD04_04415 [Candidatus Caccosoma faecigallinarum]|uniref:Uncharacterized protein n=1 Tax=Candidatus Caccosoma faecigallinarum TaxID=2840720 RepID=A0A9D1GA67_9FIRM|nr:hypothetical protein [Candidatus Caccosoma faecigallinarum]
MIKEKQQLRISKLGHTWILDFDGTLVVHNGYKTGEDKFLPAAKEFLQSIPKEDFILILTAREKEAREKTIKFLKENGVRYNEILFEMPMGERILINDDKPSGLRCAHAITPKRNQGLEHLDVVLDENL